MTESGRERDRLCWFRFTWTRMSFFLGKFVDTIESDGIFRTNEIAHFLSAFSKWEHQLERYEFYNL